MKRCALVVRVSDERQGDRPDTSPDNQLQQLHKYIEWKNADIGEEKKDDWLTPVKEYRLIGVKGKDSFDSAEFKALRADVDSGLIDIVMATGLDRFGRNVKKFLEFFEFLRKDESRKVELVVTHYQIDTATPTGQLVITILMALAEMQSKQLSMKIRGARHSLFEKGLKTGGSVPLGFDRHPTRTGLYVVNETEAKIVRFAFKQYQQIKNLKKTVRVLNEKGYRTKQIRNRKGQTQGGRLFNSLSLKYVLENWIYIGYMEEHKENKRKPFEKVPEGSRYMRYLPENSNEWPIIVDQAVFLDVQKILEEHAITNKPGARKTHPYYLSGLVSCTECGFPMEADKGKEAHHYYACKNKGCPARGSIGAMFPRLKRNTIESADLEKAMQVLIREKVLQDPQQVSELRKAINKAIAGEIPDLKDEARLQRKRLEELVSKKDGIFISLKQNENRQEIIARLSSDLMKTVSEIEDVEHQLSKLEEAITSGSRRMVDDAAVRKALLWMSDQLSVIPEGKMKELYASFFDRVMVGVEEIEAHLRLDTVMVLARKGPDPTSFDWTKGWYARQELNPQPTGP